MANKKDNRWNREDLHQGWKDMFKNAQLIGEDEAGDPLYQAIGEVTPEMAGHVIDNLNENNFRNMSMKACNKIAKDMTDGKFVINNDAIVFHPNFSLANGQHRMQAIVLSGKTVRMIIIFGYINDKNMDSGMKRKFADYLRNIRGVKNAGEISSALSEVHIHVRGIGGADDSSNAPTHEELDVLYSYFSEGAVAACNKIHTLDKRVRLGHRTKIFGMYLIFLKIDKDMANKLMDMLYLVSPGPDSIDRISSVIRKNTNARYEKGIRTRTAMAGIIHAWNALITGKNNAPKSISRWTDGGYPKIIGLPSMVIREDIVSKDSIKRYPHVSDMIAANDIASKELMDATNYDLIIATALRGPGKITISVTASKLGVSSKHLNKMLNTLHDAGIINVSGKGRDRILVSRPEMAYGTGYFDRVVVSDAISAPAKA